MISSIYELLEHTADSHLTNELLVLLYMPLEREDCCDVNKNESHQPPLSEGAFASKWK